MYKPTNHLIHVSLRSETIDTNANNTDKMQAVILTNIDKKVTKIHEPDKEYGRILSYVHDKIFKKQQADDAERKCVCVCVACIWKRYPYIFVRLSATLTLLMVYMLLIATHLDASIFTNAQKDHLKEML